MDTQIGYQNREELIQEIQYRLGGGMVDVELDREHYDVAIKLAISKYRQLSSGSVEESIMFVQTKPDVTKYYLPDEVMEVHAIYRRGVGTNSGFGSNFDPFDVAFNIMYLLNAGQIGGIATFDAFSQYKETIGRVFGSSYDFYWHRNDHQLEILRNVRVEEDIAVAVHNLVPEMVLLKDIYAAHWISNYAYAQSKWMLGEARSKYQSGLPGAGGAVTLNGEQLKQEAQQEIEQLKEAVHNMEEGNSPLGFTIG